MTNAQAVIPGQKESPAALPNAPPAEGSGLFRKRNLAVEPDPSSAPRIREGSSPSLRDGEGNKKTAHFGENG